MDPNSTLQADLELFRRVMRVMKVLSHQDTADQPLPPSPRMSRQPASNYDLQRWRPEMDFQDDSMEDSCEQTDDDDEDDDEEDEDDDCNDSEEEEDQDEEDEDDEGSESDDSSDYFEVPQLSEGPSSSKSPKEPAHVLSFSQPPASLTNTVPGPAKDRARYIEQEAGDDADLCCWEHGCNGRSFTTRSNLRRHQREKSRARPVCQCPRCGAIFSRTTARNTHIARGSCNRIRRYSNGRIRPNLSASPRRT